VTGRQGAPVAPESLTGNSMWSLPSTLTA
jgi:hypothetical protein